MGRSANYSVVQGRFTIAEFLVIRDVGPWDEHLTVTNDAEAVVAELLRTGILMNGQRLLYYDSGGALDELLIVGGKFSGFAPGPRGNVA